MNCWAAGVLLPALLGQPGGVEAALAAPGGGQVGLAPRGGQQGAPASQVSGGHAAAYFALPVTLKRKNVVNRLKIV